MIKHRFILRDVADFRVFAAIPVEASLLTWMKWRRPPDEEGLRKLFEDGEAYFTAGLPLLRHLVEEIDHIHAPAEMPLPNADKFWEHMQSRQRHARDKLIPAFTDAIERCKQWRAPDVAYDFAAAVTSFADSFSAPGFLQLIEAERAAMDHVKAWRAVCGEYAASEPDDSELTETAIACANAYTLVAQLGREASEFRSVIVPRAAALISADPLPDTPCPPGLPFAAYTVEFNGTVVNVVEGCAWVDKRATASEIYTARTDELRNMAKEGVLAGAERESVIAEANRKIDQWIAATDEEKRVVEIVSQMLTERSLNPKVDTKIHVREVDPKHAHQTREAEKRDALKTRATVRTIKFEVMPPRYLREAAEHILASPRKAHWVIGHWRNQPYGERHALRRQSWIKPHIRGLGEASGTTSRIVAPHPVTSA